MIPTALLAGTEISVKEIQSTTAFSTCFPFTLYWLARPSLILMVHLCICIVPLANSDMGLCYFEVW